jgi:hypothetical protein
MGLHDMIELCRSPACSWQCPRIHFVWKAQLVLKVLSNPLCQLGGQPAQGRVHRPVFVLQPLRGRGRSVWQGNKGGRVLYKIKLAGLGKVDVKVYSSS